MISPLFAQSKDYRAVRDVHERLLYDYDHDFSKYAAGELSERIRLVWESTIASKIRSSTYRCTRRDVCRSLFVSSMGQMRSLDRSCYERSGVSSDICLRITSVMTRQVNAHTSNRANPGMVVPKVVVDAARMSGGKNPPRPPHMETMPLASPACLVK